MNSESQTSGIKTIPKSWIPRPVNQLNILKQSSSINGMNSKLALKTENSQANLNSNKTVRTDQLLKMAREEAREVNSIRIDTPQNFEAH